MALFIKTKGLQYFFIIIFTMLSLDNIYGQEKITDKEMLEPYKKEYLNYVPDFIDKISSKKLNWVYSDKEMELSSEVKFFTLNQVEEINRANALVKAGMEGEATGDYRKAMTIYQDIINKYSITSINNEVLYRVSAYGVFVPVAQYCQRRILNFPKEHLDLFRTLRDPEAKELFDEAAKKYSLELFSEIIDKYLATSYGGKSLLFLGDAAFDQGNYLEALEYFETIVNYIPDKNLQTPELSLKIQFCQKALGLILKTEIGASKSNLLEKDLKLLEVAIKKETPLKTTVQTQKTSSDYISGDDYTRFKPTKDPLGLILPEWENEVLDSKDDNCVYAQPVITDTSVVVRMKNIIYCYSIINGTLLWKNDLGGRNVWQNWNARQYPLEDIVIQDGIIATPLIKGGTTSLVALDEITGQIKWSFGAMNASEGDECKMRFKTAPAAGPGTIYANYVLDNIKGNTHIDTEYGTIAFEATTGRVKWRRQVCRLQPGKYDGSFNANVRVNSIRSFFTPPLYHEGTVYSTSNAGAVVAMDSRSGRIKWLMKYPYYPDVHNLRMQFGTQYRFQPPRPMFWLNQRPLVIGEQLYILPVNSPFLLCLDRKTGKVNWTFNKPTSGFEYFLGTLSTGELVITGNGRSDSIANNSSHPVYLVEPKTGKITWQCPDIIIKENQPVLTTYIRGTPTLFNVNENYYETVARPFLSEDDKLIISSYTDIEVTGYYGVQAFAIGEIDLKNKKILSQRRFYSGTLLTLADFLINQKERLKSYAGTVFEWVNFTKELPRKTKEQESTIIALEKVLKDTVPVNEHPPFMPFSRITFTRFGVPFELRLSPRKISMVYNRSDFESKLVADNTLMSLYNKCELSVKDGDFNKAAEYLGQCLLLVSPEDVNFRALIKGQFYRIYLELTRSAVRDNNTKQQMKNTLEMSNTVSSLPEEVETLFALAEGYIKNKEIKKAATCLRTLIEVYGLHEFPISSLAAKTCFYPEELSLTNETINGIFNHAKENSYQGILYKKEAQNALDLTSKSIPLYLSAVSPLPKNLTVSTGDLAIFKLIELLKNSGSYEAEYSKTGDIELASEKIDQLMYHIIKYPATSKGQETFNRIFTLTASLPDENKRVVWRKLSHVAKICRFNMPGELTAFCSVFEKNINQEINTSFGNSSTEIENFKDGIMITLDREGDHESNPNLLFVGVKLPKKVGFRFSVVCFDLLKGKEVWRKEEFRLKDLGQEPGFIKAYVYKDVIVVNGIYDVFGFNIKDGAELWHYKVPYNFEIEEAAISGNLFTISGNSETIALQIETNSLVGEVAWQQKEEGNLYYKPFFINDILVSVRKYPFNITSRDRTTGNLVARLELPDLSEVDEHPILKNGPLELPISHFKGLVVVTDGKYILLYDVLKMKLVWKTLLMNLDAFKEIKMRVAINEKFITMTKEDFDNKAIYCYSIETGATLWNTEAAKPNSAKPIYSMQLEGDFLYGINDYSGAGFYYVVYDCKNGVRIINKLIEGFSSIPLVNLRKTFYGKHVVIELQDRKDFQLLVIDKKSGEVVKKVTEKGDGPIGEIGRVAMNIQNGHPILFCKNKFKY